MLRDGGAYCMAMDMTALIEWMTVSANPPKWVGFGFERVANSQQKRGKKIFNPLRGLSTQGNFVTIDPSVSVVSDL